MPQTLHNWIALKEKTARCCRLAKQNGEVFRWLFLALVQLPIPDLQACRIATCELGMLRDLFKRLRFLSGCVFITSIRATESFSYRLWNKGILKELNLVFFFWGNEVKGPLFKFGHFFYGSINDLIQMIFLKHCSHSSSIGFAGCYCTIKMLFMKPFGFAFCFQTTQKIWLQENCICFIVAVSSLSWCGMTLGKVFLSWKTELYKKLLS